MKIAITGVSSYLAQVLLPLLEADAGVEEIIGVDIKEPPVEFRKVRFIRRDVRDPALADDFKAADTLIHLAFIVMPIRDAAETNSINIQGSINAFEAAARAGLRKIVYSSSVAAYGSWPDHPAFITEDVPVRGLPDFYYSWTKAEVEKYLDGFEEKHPGMIVTRLRPCIFVGPGINNVMRRIASARMFVRFKDKNCRLQLVWDEDVADAIHAVTSRDFPGAFNIAGDNPVYFNDIGDLIGVKSIDMSFSTARALVKLGWKLHLTGMLSPEWLDVGRYSIIMDCTKAKTTLGWKPRYDTAGALLKLLEYKEELAKQP